MSFVSGRSPFSVSKACDRAMWVVTLKWYLAYRQSFARYLSEMTSNLVGQIHVHKSFRGPAGAKNWKSALLKALQHLQSRQIVFSNPFLRNLSIQKKKHTFEKKTQVSPCVFLFYTTDLKTKKTHVLYKKYTIKKLWHNIKQIETIRAYHPPTNLLGMLGLWGIPRTLKKNNLRIS